MQSVLFALDQRLFTKNIFRQQRIQPTCLFLISQIKHNSCRAGNLQLSSKYGVRSSVLPIEKTNVFTPISASPPSCCRVVEKTSFLLFYCSVVCHDSENKSRLAQREWGSLGYCSTMEKRACILQNDFSFYPHFLIQREGMHPHDLHVIC